MLELFQLVSLSTGSDVLNAIVIFEDFFRVRLDVSHLFNFVKVFADQFRVPEGVYLFLQKFYLFVFVIDCLFQRFYVSCSLLKQSSLLNSSKLHLFIGELISTEDLRYV